MCFFVDHFCVGNSRKDGEKCEKRYLPAPPKYEPPPAPALCAKQPVKKRKNIHLIQFLDVEYKKFDNGRKIL